MLEKTPASHTLLVALTLSLPRLPHPPALSPPAQRLRTSVFSGDEAFLNIRQTAVAQPPPPPSPLPSPSLSLPSLSCLASTCSTPLSAHRPSVARGTPQHQAGRCHSAPPPSLPLPLSFPSPARPPASPPPAQRLCQYVGLRQLSWNEALLSIRPLLQTCPLFPLSPFPPFASCTAPTCSTPLSGHRPSVAPQE